MCIRTRCNVGATHRHHHLTTVSYLQGIVGTVPKKTDCFRAREQGKDGKGTDGNATMLCVMLPTVGQDNNVAAFLGNGNPSLTNAISVCVCVVLCAVVLLGKSLLRVPGGTMFGRKVTDHKRDHRKHSLPMGG